MPMKPPSTVPTLRRITGLAVPVILMMSCGQAKLAPQSFAGCYSPALHPDLDSLNAVGGNPTWMRLDTVLEPRAIGMPGYRIILDTTSASTSGLWHGWWRPTGDDSLEIVWSASGFIIRDYRLRLSAGKLEGHVIGSTHLMPKQPIEHGNASAVRQDENASASCNPESGG